MVKRNSLLAAVITCCVLFASPSTLTFAAESQKDTPEISFFNSISYDKGVYSWNSLNSQMTKEDVLKKESLSKKDVFDATVSPGLVSSFVRHDSDKISQYSFDDIKPLITDYNVIYLFDKEGYFKRFNYDIYLNATIEPNYTKANSVSAKFNSSNLEFEQIKNNILIFLEKAEKNYGPATNSYGSSESNPKFWEKSKQSNETEYYFEERFGSSPGSSLILSVDKQFIEGQGLIYHISVDVSSVA